MRLFTHKDPKKSIFNIIYIFIGLLALMMGYFAYFQIARSKEVINSTYNKRQDILAERVVRGKVLSSDGQVLAETLVDGEGNEIRNYPYGEVFAHVVGRFLKGKTGIEEAENIRLLTSSINSFEVMYADLTGEKSLGDNVVITLDSRLQQVAYEALGDYKGAAIILEPSTGKILAMVSKPSYDPNTIDLIWENLIAKEDDKESPLYNRATQGLYPPGSTFKILTALEYIRENPLFKKYKYDCDGSIDYDKMTIHCYNKKSHGVLNLPNSFAKSCNTSFASIGKTLNLNDFHTLCESFLFNTDLPVTMASSRSSFTLQKGVSGTEEAMQTAIGQGNTLISPLHNAMIAATIANRGVMMKPYVIDHIENAEGGIIKRYSPKVAAEPMNSFETDYISKMMRLVVTDGTGKKLKNLKVETAGKTGSADHGAGEPAHAWFIGYAPYENPKIAVSIIVESVGTGSDYAVPIAKKIFEAYFEE